MNKYVKILLVVLLISTLSLLLVGCESQDPSSLEKYYYLLDDDANSVEVLELNGNDFTIYTLNSEDKVLNEFYDEVKADTEASIKSYTTSTKKGSYTYLNNAFVENRLDLNYEGDERSTYVYLKDGDFAYSPKMPIILLYALIGFCITLVVLCVLMGIIKLLGFSVDKITAKVKSKANKTEIESETAVGEVRLAKGSAGELKLENVSDRDAAMIMAIVADQMGVPLNTLRFKSIKDITDQESEK